MTKINRKTVHARKRREMLDAQAQLLGFETWARLETAVYKGKVELAIKEQKQ